MLQLRIPAGAPGHRHRKAGGASLEHHTPRPIDKLQSRQPQAGQLARRPGVAVGGIPQGDVGHPRPEGRVAIKQGQLFCIAELGQQHQGPGRDGGRDVSHTCNVRSIQPGTQAVAIALNKAFALATELPQQGKARGARAARDGRHGSWHSRHQPSKNPRAGPRGQGGYEDEPRLEAADQGTWGLGIQVWGNGLAGHLDQCSWSAVGWSERLAPGGVENLGAGA